MLSISLIKKWKRMLKHESVLHVDQVEGKYYSVSNVEGYYNDLRKKVCYTSMIDSFGIPYNIAVSGKLKKKVYFPISIFQYGLGAYDLFLERKEDKFKQKMLLMADWAVNNQHENGSWDTFGILGYQCPVSSMAQGEGASLFARAYVATGNEIYRTACIKAIDFMLKPVSEGGTSLKSSDGLILMEYPQKAAVLNGWIFSAFGLFDCWKITGNEKYLEAWELALNGIKKNIVRFDSRHWSCYDWNGKYTSPFYHELHIELLKCVNKLSPDAVFERYIEKWTKCKESRFWSSVAFIVKAKQKVLERKSEEWILI